MSAARMNPAGLLRHAGGFLLNLFVAEMGPAIAEREFYKIFPAHTLQSAYLKEIPLSFTIALLLGGLVYYKWKPPQARGVWVVGICLFLWHAANHSSSYGTMSVFRAWSTLDFASVRAIGYSIGALVGDDALRALHLLPRHHHD